jgi:phosphopentomutase
MPKRVFLIVLDSMGIGEMPDAARWGDEGSNTLGAIRNHPSFDCPNLSALGLFDIDTVGGGTGRFEASVARMHEASMGKDTTIGHWEIAGVISPRPLPTYPEGFPADLIAEFEALCGRKTICNRPYSGTDVIRDFGEEHLRTGALIVYTSADSVFQIAAHEDVVSVETLYDYCRTARQLLCGEHTVGRVIARPFVGTSGTYTRTANRHDFSAEPPSQTVLDAVKAAGLEVKAIGKITDIFAGRGVTETIRTKDNADGMQQTERLAKTAFEGLCFTNLVDFDMLYGHRNNADGYTDALNAFDVWLRRFLPLLAKDDLLIITADHGCDPGDVSTDHTREYVPLLLYGGGIQPRDLGTRSTFADVAATIADYLSVPYQTAGETML